MVHTITTRSARGIATGASDARITLKIAVFTPIPNPSVSTTTAAKPGVRRSARAPYFGGYKSDPELLSKTDPGLTMSILCWNLLYLVDDVGFRGARVTL